MNLYKNIIETPNNNVSEYILKEFASSYISSCMTLFELIEAKKYFKNLIDDKKYSEVAFELVADIDDADIYFRYFNDTEFKKEIFNNIKSKITLENYIKYSFVFSEKEYLKDIWEAVSELCNNIDDTIYATYATYVLPDLKDTIEYTALRKIKTFEDFKKYQSVFCEWPNDVDIVIDRLLYTLNKEQLKYFDEKKNYSDEKISKRYIELIDDLNELKTYYEREYKYPLDIQKASVKFVKDYSSWEVVKSMFANEPNFLMNIARNIFQKEDLL